MIFEYPVSQMNIRYY